VSLTGNIENDDDEFGLDELRRFRNLPQIRLEELRRNVTACLERQPTVTLQQVLDFFPPSHGMMEVAGYVIVAAGDQHHYVGDDTQVLELPPPHRQRWRVPRVLFCKP
jgi:hypothetical protein